ncbi:MAG: hypothetical protein ACRBBP_04050 [Bdellovibrionales bacterium]
MKKILLMVITLGVPFFAKAHCPAEVTHGGEVYCAAVNWLSGEKKVKGEFVDAGVETPYRVPMREVPQKWVYSIAVINLWAKGDRSHTPVMLEGFRVFQYMAMENGHNHGGSYEFNETEESYVLSKMALQQMRGCWLLRWTFAQDDSVKDSTELMKIGSYKNLSDEENEISMGFCMSSGGDTDEGDGSGHHNH